MTEAFGSSAFALLAACCRWPAAERTDAVRRAARDIVDWPAFAGLVTRHRVAGLVNAALAAAEIDPPAAIRERIAAESATIARRNLTATAETLRLQALFDREGIDVRFFKGIALAQLAYGSVAIKHGKDIDFIVPAHEVRHCVGLLEQLGYRLWQPRHRLTDRQWRSISRFHMEVAMVRPGTALQVEPHWRLTWNPRLLDIAPMLAAPPHVVAIEGGHGIRTFAIPDLLVYLCVHGAQSGWFRLKWLADLNALLTPMTPDEIERLLGHALARGAEASAVLALALCNRVFGRAVPPCVADRMRRSWALRRLEARALANLADMRPTLDSALGSYEFQLLLGWAQGCFLSQAAHLLVGMTDVVSVPLPAPLRFLYPLLRLPLGLWRRVARLAGAPGEVPLPGGPPA